MGRNYLSKSVLDASRERISYTFDNFEKIYLSLSGGKDSTTMFHLVIEEAIKRNRKIGYSNRGKKKYRKFRRIC